MCVGPVGVYWTAPLRENRIDSKLHADVSKPFVIITALYVKDLNVKVSFY